MKQFVRLSLLLYMLTLATLNSKASPPDPTENEVLKGDGGGLPKKYVTYPNAKEKESAEAKGCANGEKTFYDGCNTCSCPDNGRNVSFCTYRLCMKRVVA